MQMNLFCTVNIAYCTSIIMFCSELTFSRSQIWFKLVQNKHALDFSIQLAFQGSVDVSVLAVFKLPVSDFGFFASKLIGMSIPICT